jgi:hypothetical protein
MHSSGNAASRSPQTSSASAKQVAGVSAGSEAECKVYKRKKLSQGRSRLLKAIDNDNKDMLRRLGVVEVVSGVLCVAILALFVTYYFVSAVDVEYSRDLMTYTYEAAHRNSVSLDACVHLALLRVIATSTDPASALFVVFKPLMHPYPPSFASIVASYTERTELSFRNFQTLSNEVDTRHTRSSELRYIRQADVFPVDLPNKYVPGGTTQMQVSVSVVASFFSSLGQLSVFQNLPTSIDDIGYIYVIVNTLTDAVRVPLEKVVTITLDELSSVNHQLFIITVIFLVVSAALVILTVSLVLGPAVVYAEQAKLRVLNIFLAVPDVYRRQFRRSAMMIYQKVEKVRDGAVVHFDDIELEDDTALSAVTSSSNGQSQRQDRASVRYSMTRASTHLSSDNDNGSVNAAPATPTAATPCHPNDGGKDSSADDGGRETMGSVYFETMRAKTGEEQPVKRTVSVWDLRGALVVPILFLILVCSFFIIQLIAINTVTAKQEQAALNVYIASTRSQRYQFALSFGLQNIATDKMLLAMLNPNDPLLKGPDFDVGSSRALAEGRAANFAVLFGNSLGINEPLNDMWQNKLMFESICEFPRERAYELMPSLRTQPQVFRDCDVLSDGVAHRGLYGMISSFDDDLAPLTSAKYSRGIATLLYPGVPITSELTPMEAYAALETFTKLNQLFNDYIYHLLDLSSRIYLDYGRTYMERLVAIRMMLIFIFPCVLLCFYIIAFNKLIRDMLRAAAASNAIMLLLPQQIVKHVAPAQEYIEQNVSRD